MRSYEAARTYFSILAFFSWCLIIGGGIVALLAGAALSEMASYGYGRGPSAMAFVTGLGPGLGIAFLGFLGLVGTQIGRASVDTAELTQQMLKVARDQLEVSQRSLKAAGQAPATFAASASAASQAPKKQYHAQEARQAEQPSTSTAGTAPSTDKLIEYRGRQIERQGSWYKVESETFINLSRAQKFIDVGIDGVGRQSTPEPARLGPATTS